MGHEEGAIPAGKVVGQGIDSKGRTREIIVQRISEFAHRGRGIEPFEIRKTTIDPWTGTYWVNFFGRRIIEERRQTPPRTPWIPSASEIDLRASEIYEAVQEIIRNEDDETIFAYGFRRGFLEGIDSVINQSKRRERPVSSDSIDDATGTEDSPGPDPEIS